MSIQIRRVLVCDGCEAISTTVLATTDQDTPDWQGWQPIRDDTDGEAIKHLCPECASRGVLA